MLLFCFLLYHFGYYVFYFSYKLKIEADWKATVHEESSNLHRTMEIPAKLPYLVDQEDFQNTNIAFKRNGKSYRIIKKRFVNDAFQLVYVPDIAKIKLDHNFKQWVISVSSDSNTENNGDQVLAKIFLKDYTQPSAYSLFNNTFVTSSNLPTGFLLPLFKDQSTNLITPPPETFFL